MSRPGASWWPHEVVEELPGNSRKRCKVENINGRIVAESSFSDLVAKPRGDIKSDETHVKWEHPENEKSSSTPKIVASNQSTDKEKGRDDVWIVRKVVEDSSEDEDDQKYEVEGEELEGGQDSSGANQSQSLPGRFENDFNRMCLHEAAEKRLFNAVFHKKEDINHINEFGETPLHFAAEIGATSIASLLIDRGANPNLADDDGFTPLILAASFGHAEMVEILLEGGADVHHHDELMMAPIHHAAHSGFEDVIRVLLDHGADPTQEDFEGHMPCDFAFHGGHLHLAEYLFEILDDDHGESHEDDRQSSHANAVLRVTCHLKRPSAD